GIGTIQEPAGATNLARNRLMVDAPNLQWARSIGIHELKHLIDWIEKHPPGGSPRQFMEVGVPEREAHDLYNRLVREVAARNAQKGLDWGDLIRRLRRPAATEDVPRDRSLISTTIRGPRHSLWANRTALAVDPAVDKNHAIALQSLKPPVEGGRTTAGI